MHWNDHFLHRAKAAAETQVLAEISQIFLVGSEKVLDLEAPCSPKQGVYGTTNRIDSSLYIGKLGILDCLHPLLPSFAREHSGVILLRGLQSKICICYRGQNIAAIICIVVDFPVRPQKVL